MNNLIIAILPAILWGCMPIFTSKIGGRTVNQILGTTFGALLTAIVFFVALRPNITSEIFLFSFLSGLSWSLGQVLQYESFKALGVSKAMPISTGLQIVGTSFGGVLLFSEWASTSAKIAGFVAIIIIIGGIYLTTISEKTPENASNAPKIKTSSIFWIFFFSTIGYVGFSIFPRYAAVQGFDGFLPQTIGMVLGALICMFLPQNKDVRPLKETVTYKNMLVGVIFAGGSLSYLISAGLNGVATGFTISQMNVVFSTLGGVYILKEAKTKKELTYTLIGLLLVIAGGIMISFMTAS
ncbi:GRP family sugar transporter [Holzapfeliella floricola]|nr:GRP family sugar transporter [Holzapfeliella floricola]